MGRLGGGASSGRPFSALLPRPYLLGTVHAVTAQAGGPGHGLRPVFVSPWALPPERVPPAAVPFWSGPPCFLPGGPPPQPVGHPWPHPSSL